MGFYLKLAFSCFNPMVLFVPWTSMAELVLCPWTGGISTSILIIDQCLITPPSYETLSKKHWEYKYYMSESDTQRSRGGIPWLMTDRCAALPIQIYPNTSGYGSNIGCRWSGILMQFYLLLMENSAVTDFRDNAPSVIHVTSTKSHQYSGKVDR